MKSQELGFEKGLQKLSIMTIVKTLTFLITFRDIDMR